MKLARWWLLVKNAKGVVIFNKSYFFRSSAVDAGERVATEHLSYEVRRG